MTGRIHVLGTMTAGEIAGEALAWVTLLALIGLAIVLWISRAAAPGRSLALCESIETVPVASSQAIRLSVPMAGALSIDLSLKSGAAFSVQVMRRGSQATSAAGASRLGIFSAEQIGDYRRVARVERGDYDLIVGNPRRGDQDVELRVRVVARLKPRRRKRRWTVSASGDAVGLRHRPAGQVDLEGVALG